MGVLGGVTSVRLGDGPVLGLLPFDTLPACAFCLHLTLQATAFFLRRRVMIVSDHFFDQCSVTVVEPHLLVARGVWCIIVTAVPWVGITKRQS